MKNFFTVGKNKIGYLGNNFEEWFGEMPSAPKKVKLYFKKLDKYMTDQDILSELKPSKCTLDDIAWALKENKQLLTNGYANIFYVRDAKGELRSVNAFWYGFIGGWDVGASGVAGPGGWRGGSRVFSRNSYDLKTLIPLSSAEAKAEAVCPWCKKPINIKLEK